MPKTELQKFWGVVGNDWQMDPKLHDVVFDGRELKPGMRVLIADDLARSATDYYLKSDVLRRRALEASRWCKVGRIEFETYPEHDDEGRVVGTNTLVKFVAYYDDGTIAVRRYSTTYAWYAVKPVGEYAQIVREGFAKAFPSLVPAIYGE